MTFVIDASIALSWHFPDEKNTRSDAVLQRLGIETARAPQIFWFELRNVLVLGERRQRAAARATETFLQFLSTLSIEITDIPDEFDVIALARRHRLTFYDACYLELAARERLPLATLDAALARAASADGIALIGTS